MEDYIKEAFAKTLSAIQKNKDLLSRLEAISLGSGLNVENLANAACNHLFDDWPDSFGISEQEGGFIRGYFINLSDYEYVEELHKEFPDILEEEGQEYMNNINEHRKAE